MKTNHNCIIGDSRQMAEVPASSIHLVVTSPPYWQLKDYGSADQIGFNDSYEEYVNNLNLAWNECNRVLHPGCRMLVNIGDQFARSVYYGRYKVIPIRTEIIKFCETIGFDYMGAIIWQKKTTMNTTGGATVMGSFPFPRNGVVEIDYEFILIFRKPGQPPKVDKSIKQQSRIAKEKWKEYFSGHWYFGGAKQKGHIAVFPLELPKRAIEMFTFVGETVLDPFAGSATTSLAAILTNRNSVSYEINPEFIPAIEKKLNPEQIDLPHFFEVTVHSQESRNVDWRQMVERLPYIFQDPVSFDKRVDPKQHHFGSKISVGDRKLSREAYFTVKDILGTNLIKLSDGRIIRLLGVKPKRNVPGEAEAFLSKKILKRRIFLKYDEIKSDHKDRQLAYVYMKNRTFINAHLLKEGLAEIDTEFRFQHLARFQKFVAHRG